MEKKKRRWGDRKDGTLLRDLDGMHFITPLIYPNSCDNEAYIAETIDLTNLNAYLKKRNESEAEFPYTMFHIIVAALIKTITLRPNGQPKDMKVAYTTKSGNAVSIQVSYGYT